MQYTAICMKCIRFTTGPVKPCHQVGNVRVDNFRECLIEHGDHKSYRSFIDSLKQAMPNASVFLPGKITYYTAFYKNMLKIILMLLTTHPQTVVGNK